MVGLPLYDPGGTQRTQAQQGNNPSPDAFGGATARALTGLGNTVQNVGDKFAQIEARAKEQDDKTAVIDGLAEASNRQRTALYGDGGLLTRTGKNAEGLPEDAMATMEQIGGDISKRFTDPKQQAAFHAAWTGQTQSTVDAAARTELDQKQKYRTATKTAALASLTDDAVAAYNDEEVLGQKLDQARTTIRSNPDGLPDNMIEQMERESVSAMQVQVIQRMAQDNPGRALDYYTRHKGDISGADHAKVDGMISGVSRVREAGQYVDEIASGGQAASIIKSVIGAESAGQSDAVSATGAAGHMQLQPDTAREVAQTLPGLGARIAGKTDDELAAYWQTPQGVKDNIRIGATYLNKQLSTFNGDLEAALIAYNAGPANATKWLNAGRDYDALPKKEETLPYVKKIFASLGYDASGDTSSDIQAATKASSYFKGDAQSFLASKLQPGKPAEYITNMKPALQNSVAGLINDAPDFVKAGLNIYSGARSNERQAELWAGALKKYGSAAAARKWVAPPAGAVIDGKVAEGSQHTQGEAVDLGWNGGSLANAPPDVIKWVHDNSAKYGLTFPLSNESWHVELKGARGAAPKGGRLTAADGARGDQTNIANRFAQQPPAPPPEGVGTVTMAPSTGNPADIYTKNVAPFSVAADASNINDWLQTARDNLADNPSLLAEVERQLTDKSQMQTASATAAAAQLKTEIFRSIVGGDTVKGYFEKNPTAFAAAPPDAVKSMLEFESSWNKGSNESDPATYYKLSQMDGKELHELGPNIIDYAPKLSKEDLKGFIDKAGTFAKTGGMATRSTDQNRTQITTSAQNILALDPNKRPEDAKTMASLNRAFDVQINGYIERTGKEPDGTAMQGMMDQLLLQGHIKKWGPDTAAVAFQVKPEDRNSFYAASTINDVPAEALPVVSKAAASIWQLPPDADGTVRVPEDMAVSFYNDLVVTQLGGAPTPPDKIYSKIADGLARKLGRVPQQDEVSAFYRQWIQRTTQGN